MAENTTNNAKTNADGMTNLEGLGNEEDFAGLGSVEPIEPVKPIDDSLRTDSLSTKTTTTLSEEDKRILAEKEAQGLIVEEARKLGLPDNTTAEQIKQFKESQNKVVQIDGFDYVLDKEGNALTKDGTGVFKTKAEIDQMIASQAKEDGTNSDEETTAVEDLIKLAGVHPLGEDGKPKVYEDSIEGVLQASMDIAREEGRKTFLAHLNSSPEYKKYFEYLQRGGDPREFHKQTASSWKAVKFDPKNKDMATNVVVANLVRTGMSEEKAKVTAKLYSDTDQLEEMGKDSYKTLVQLEDQREELEKTQYAERVKADEQEELEHWTNVQKAIKKGTINNIVIPESDRDGFFHYLAKPVDKERNSQSIIDNEALETEQWLQLEYLKYKKFDLSKLVAATAETKRIMGLKSRFVNKQTGLEGASGINTTKFQSNTNNLDDIDINSIQTGKK